MYKLGGRKKLGRKSSHRKALINNQLRSLLLSGSVVTTTPKAKVLKANVNSYLAQIAKLDKEHAKVSVYKLTGNNDVAVKVSEYVSGQPSVKIVKVGFRSGDNAQTSKVWLSGFTSKSVKSSNKSKTSKEVEKEMTDDKTNKTKAPVKQQEDKTSVIKKALTGKLGGKERARSRSGL